MSVQNGKVSVCSNLLCIVSLALLAGCQQGPAMPTSIPVTGEITYQGEPVEKASVTLVSSDPKGKNATGLTNDQGVFTLQTYIDPTHSLNGAIAGDYHLTVTKTDEVTMSTTTGKGPAAPPSAEEMNKFTQAMLEASKPRKSLIPKKYADPLTTQIKVTVKAGLAPLEIELKD